METRLQSGARVAPAGDTARQFVIERECLSCKPSPEARLYSYPYSLWVDGPFDDDDRPCGPVLAVSERDAIVIRTQTKVSATRPVTVCSCQGYFIE